MKTAFLIVLCTLFLSGMNAQGPGTDNERSMRIYNLAAESAGYLEGYASGDGRNEFSYHSLRNDLKDCMLSRCTDGSMQIGWETSVVPRDFKGDGIGFVWIAAMDLSGARHSFDVTINGIKRFSLPTGKEETKEALNEEGGRLQFITAEKDQHGDGHGYMTLWAPAAWLEPGRPLKIGINGEAKGSNTWIIVYKAADALAYLQESVRYNARAKLGIREAGGQVVISAEPSAQLCGKTINLMINNKLYPMQVSPEGHATLVLPGGISRWKKIVLSDASGEILSAVAPFIPGTHSKLAKLALIETRIETENGQLVITGNRVYKPNTYRSILALDQSLLSKGSIRLMSSSHQDIAWMDSPEKCILERDTMLMTPLIRRALVDPAYRFDIEDALMLKEYIGRHPERKEDIRTLLANGRLSCGSSYNQPYEELHSGEALARQFYFGSNWLKKEFGYTANTYWNMDVPGRTLQMAQILKKSGTEYMALSRMTKGIYNWHSPDGSFVTTYSPGHYADDYTPLQKNFYEAAEHIARSVLVWESYQTPVIPLLSDWDMSPAKDYSSLIRQWNQIRSIDAGDGKQRALKLPPVELALTPDFLRDFRENAANIPSIRGERPAVWLYIHGPTHHHAISASRESEVLLTAAEKFATANALVSNSFSRYPEERLRNAWEAKLYPDHGWGGKHGDITDALFLEKYVFARNEAEQILRETQTELASRIQTNPSRGIPLIVFNSIGWDRTDKVSGSLRFDESTFRGIELTDPDGKRIPVQTEVLETYPDGSIRSASIHFVAESVPSIGYTTYFLHPGKQAAEPENLAGTVTLENAYYRILLGKGGIRSVVDKQNGRELLDTSKFQGGEVFTMHSEGTGAGEFSDIQQPDMQGFDKTSNYDANWKQTASGDVFTEFTNRQPIRNAVVEQKVRLYHQLKQIDLEVSLLNYEGVLYREYRMALPLNMQQPEISYEVPFGVVTVGKDELEGAAGERYTTPCREVHPRGIGNWISACEAGYGVTMSSSVAVADYVDPTEPASSLPILQPLLLASRRSCHGEGNEYLQTGNHHYHFTITSHEGNWKNGYRQGMQANEPLRAIFNAPSFSNASLPLKMSFFTTEHPDLVISTVKKAELWNDPVIRVYNISGNETEMKLRSFLGIGDAWQMNLKEDLLGSLATEKGMLQTILGKYSIETYLLKRP